MRSFSYKDYLQAGKSVEGIEEILPVAEVVRRFRAAGKGAMNVAPTSKLPMPTQERARL